MVNRERLTTQEWKEWGCRQIWEIPSVRANDIHPAMFPTALASRVIRLYTDEDDIVLDPFLGSGTTAVAAIKLNRRFIGMEKAREYFNVAQTRIDEALQESSTDIFKGCLCSVRQAGLHHAASPRFMPASGLSEDVLLIIRARPAHQYCVKSVRDTF